MAVPSCQHVKANGSRCQSPALRNENFCFFHRHTRERARRQFLAQRSGLKLQFPVLEDPESIQIAIGDVLNALVSGRIDHKSAGLMLYGLQLAAANIRRANFNPKPEECPPEYRDHEREEQITKADEYNFQVIDSERLAREEKWRTAELHLKLVEFYETHGLPNLHQFSTLKGAVEASKYGDFPGAMPPAKPPQSETNIEEESQKAKK